MRYRHNSPFGYIILAFGLGILLECCFPSSFIVCVIAITIIITGLILCRC